MCQYFPFLGCKYSGLPCSDPAEKGRQRGVLHEHPEYCSAGSEVSALTHKSAVNCTTITVCVVSGTAVESVGT